MSRRAYVLLSLWIAVLVVRVQGVRAGWDPRAMDLARELAGPTWRHPLGFGEGGVDLLYLAAASLTRGALQASVVAVVALLVGTSAGTLAGLRGGASARALRSVCDVLQAFPSFVTALVVLSAIQRPGAVHVGLVLSLTAWAPFARLALAEISVVRSLTYVEAARALGAGPLRVFARHAFPAAWPTAQAQLGTSASALLVADAGLAFLGLGAPDGVSLGVLIDQGVGVSLRAPHVLFVGAAALTFGALSLQALAELEHRPQRRPTRSRRPDPR